MSGATNSRQGKVLVIGDVMLDVFARVGRFPDAGSFIHSEIHTFPGGSAVNVAVWAARLGTPSAVVGAVGEDFIGEFIEERLSAEGVEPLLMKTKEADTGKVLVHVGPGGQRAVTSDRGANAAFSLKPEDMDRIKAARWVHVVGYQLMEPGPRKAALAAVDAAAEAGVPVSFDPGTPRLIDRMGHREVLELCSRVQVVMPNYEEGVRLTGKDDPRSIVSALAGRSNEVVLKLGEAGCIGIACGQVETVSGLTATVVDPTGAGDAFAGAFIARRLSGAGFREALEFANALAAQVVMNLGGTPRLEPIS